MTTENTLITAGSSELVASFQIEPTTAEEILASFAAPAETLQGLDKEFAEFQKSIEGQEITEEISEKAKAIRLRYVKVRTGSKTIHDDIKAKTLLRGRAIDGAYNIFKLKTTEREDPLMAIEKHFENIEIERKQKVKAERIELLKALGKEDEEFKYLDEMTEEIWTEFYNGIKATAEKAKKDAEEAAAREKIGNERRAEIATKGLLYLVEMPDGDIADQTKEDYDKMIQDGEAKKKAKEEEDKRIREENEKLAKEKEAAEAKAKAEAEKAAKEREAAEKTRKDAEEKAAKEKAALEEKLAKEKEKAAAKAKAEADAKAKEAADAKAKKEADEKATKNKAYTDWLAKNGASNELVANGDFFVQRDGDTFTLFKKIDKLAL